MSVPQAREGRLVAAALRCYPARWRRRHANEAAELAALLIRDGSPAASIACSYVIGAAREWLTVRSRRSLSTAAAALLAVACLLGFSAALVAETVPARAASTTPAPSGPVPSKVKPTSTSAGSQHQSTLCRPVLPGQVNGTIPPGGPSQLNIRGTAHVHSC